MCISLRQRVSHVGSKFFQSLRQALPVRGARVQAKGLYRGRARLQQRKIPFMITVCLCLSQQVRRRGYPL